MNSDFLNALPIGAAIIDHQQRVLVWNRILAEWTRIACADIEGQELGALFPRFNEPLHKACVSACLLSGAAPQVFSPALHLNLLPTFKPDGSPRIQILTLASLAGNLSGPLVLLTAQDITDITLHGTDLVKANKRIGQEADRRIWAERKLFEVKQRAGMARIGDGFAHIVNNQLQSITNAAELALVKLAEPEKARKWLEQIQKISGDTGRLSHQLLELSREPVVALSTVALLPVLTETLHKIGTESGCRMDIDCPQELSTVEVTASDQGLRRALTEVMRNAAEAMGSTEEGGVRILVAREEGDGRRAASQVSIAISDSGGGIRAGDLRRVFDPFYTTKGGGSGLGLTIARQRVQEFDGAITLESTPSGTTVTLRLPEAKPSVLGRKPPAPKGGGPKGAGPKAAGPKAAGPKGA